MELKTKMSVDNSQQSVNQSPNLVFKESVDLIQTQFNDLVGNVIASTIKDFHSYYTRLGYTVEFNNYLSLYSKSKDRSLRKTMKELKKENHILTGKEYFAHRSDAFAINNKNRIVFSGNLASASKYFKFPSFKKDTLELNNYYSSRLFIGHTFLGTEFQSFNFEVLNNHYMNSFNKLPIVTFRLLYSVNNCAINKVFSVYLKDCLAHFEYSDEKIISVDIRTQEEANDILYRLKNPELEFIENTVLFSGSSDGKPAPNQVLSPRDIIIYEDAKFKQAHTNLSSLLYKFF